MGNYVNFDFHINKVTIIKIELTILRTLLFNRSTYYTLYFLFRAKNKILIPNPLLNYFHRFSSKNNRFRNGKSDHRVSRSAKQGRHPRRGSSTVHVPGQIVSRGRYTSVEWCIRSNSLEAGRRLTVCRKCNEVRLEQQREKKGNRDTRRVCNIEARQVAGG